MRTLADTPNFLLYLLPLNFKEHPFILYLLEIHIFDHFGWGRLAHRKGSTITTSLQR